MQHLEIHEIANYLPDMSEEEFLGLKDDISGLGVLEPIVLLNGKILDGRHRYRACQELGIECPTKVLTDVSPNDVVISLNLHRRHLNAGQRAMVMTKLKEPFMKEARFRQQQAPGEPRGTKKSVVPKLEQQKTESEGNGRVVEILAEKAGVSKGTMHDALTVDSQGTQEQKKAVVNGKTSVSAIATDIRTRKKVETERAKPVKMMNLTNENIGWAQYSWNPVTGCKFGCDYCYARAIHDRYNIPGSFDDAQFHEDRLDMPANTKPRAGDRNNRVFVCSMGELFGDWVPQEWIDQVMGVVRYNIQWTFLFLTKNPKRLPSINFPDNVWIGATIDRANRVKATEEAFAQMPDKKLFISCEPLLEPIKISQKLLTALRLIIIGAKSNGAIKEQPDYRWVESLQFQARENGVNLWFKDNLEFLPQEAIE